MPSFKKEEIINPLCIGNYPIRLRILFLNWMLQLRGINCIVTLKDILATILIGSIIRKVI